MEAFWVQESFTRSALWLHSSACPRCQGDHVSNPVHGGRWHGPFYYREDAVELATQVGERDTLTGPHDCPICKP